MRDVRVVILLGVCVWASACSSSGGDEALPSSQTSSSGSVTAAPLTTTAVTPTTTGVDAQSPTSSLARDVRAGWLEATFIPPSELGSFVSASLITDDYALVAICTNRSDGGLATIWRSIDLSVWQDSGLEDSQRCVQQIESTPFGLFAIDDRLLFSSDGSEWTEIINPSVEAAGWPSALFVPQGLNRVTYLAHTAGQGESQVPHMVSTLDGDSWTSEPDATAAQFGQGGPVRVTPGGDGLLALGVTAGESSPFTRILTSNDGLTWRTLLGAAVGSNTALTDVLVDEQTYIAVGGDFFRTGLMASWISTDGIAWDVNPQPANDLVDPSVAHVTATDVTKSSDGYLAAGRDFDARRTGVDREFTAFWESTDGRQWTRTTTPLEGPITPFIIGINSKGTVGTWPPAHYGVQEPLRIFTQSG